MRGPRFVITGIALAAALAAGLLAAATPGSTATRGAATRGAATRGAATRGASTHRASGPAGAGTALQQALDRLVAMPSGPPGVLVIVQHGSWHTVYRAGTASLAQLRPPTIWDHVRIASVSKAFSGAVALNLVSRGKLRLSDTIGRILPAFPRAWHRVTLAELLQHRSGLPDYITSKGLALRLQRAPRKHILPIQLLRFVWHDPLQFEPGTRYLYDDSDNLVIAMMARAVTHRSYRYLLRILVYQPAGLHQTTLPAGYRMPHPYLHGYELQPGQPAIDVSEALTPSAAWASGGIVSTEADANTFIRGYLAPLFFSRHTQAAQLRFVPGDSGPPGPGTNAAGLAIFRYTTRCGTVYGHTGNGPGYTQLAAATPGGADSLAVTATEQLNTRSNPELLAALRNAETLAICDALAPH